MIDIDYFKSVNDTYGHTVGDEVLVACAAALRRVLRGSDIVARQGGDEFVAFCKSIGNARVAEDKARQISEEWRKIIPRGGDKPITGSIGIAISPRDGITFRELYEKSDKALYRAKKGGRDSFEVFEG
jgi:diguanylate cyclase (GGDEF)-like protein